MRVVCVVPSWTETLIEAGVNVIGRTPFCIHPRDKVESIPVVGGPKDVQWDKVAELKPDLLVLDKEENSRVIAERSPVPCLVTHVTSVLDVERYLRHLYEAVSQPGLLAMADRWREVCERLDKESSGPTWLELPGVLEWVHPPGAEVDRLLYLIWKNPWMAASRDTFIGSMLGLLGFGSRMIRLSAKYPTVRLEDFNPARTLLLFSSEPYPFERKKTAIRELPFPSAIVDGERFGWFGVRALRFLEEHALRLGR